MYVLLHGEKQGAWVGQWYSGNLVDEYYYCLLYTSDAADEEDSVDLGGRRIIKKNLLIQISRHTWF